MKKTLAGLLPESDRPPYRNPTWDTREDRVPLRIMIVHLLFIIWTVVNPLNSANQSILIKYFKHGASQSRLLKSALITTIIMGLCFMLPRFWRGLPEIIATALPGWGVFLEESRQLGRLS